MATESKRKGLLTQAWELTKSYSTYDVLNRVEYIYTAPTDAKDGAECTLVQYVYDAATTRIVKMKESYSTWVAATMDV